MITVSFFRKFRKRYGLQQHLKLSVSSDFDNYKGQKSWGKNKSTKIDQFLNISDSLNLCDEIDKDNNVKKQWNLSNPSNNSTLSLHIAAYENSFEGDADTVSADKNEDLNGKESALIKKWKNAKQIFLDSSTLQNPFEFPRQQAEDQNVKSDVKPEIMQFKASQKLLNPNEFIALSNDQNENKSDNLAPPPTPPPTSTPTSTSTPAPTPTPPTTTPTPTTSKTTTPKTSNPSTDKLINEHVLKTKNTVTNFKTFGC
uniref:Uncharacterized protein n=1 Tax=Panagrolaimus superbus TaxID=310955 RepID=A0A914Y8I2_9BILA